MTGEPAKVNCRLLVADTYVARLRGWFQLSGCPQTREASGVLLTNCRAVHTLHMRDVIDLVFVDRHWQIVRCISGVQPWRFRFCLSARHTIELQPGVCDLKKLKPGTRVSIVRSGHGLVLLRVETIDPGGLAAERAAC